MTKSPYHDTSISVNPNGESRDGVVFLEPPVVEAARGMIEALTAWAKKADQAYHAATCGQAVAAILKEVAKLYNSGALDPPRVTVKAEE